MIRIKKDHIFFTPKVWNGCSKPVRRKLISGHVCSYCGIVVTALFETDVPVEESLQENWSSCESVASCEGMRENHHIQPMYVSHFMGSAGAQMIMEEYHFSIGKHDAEHRCPMDACILVPQDNSDLLVRTMVSMLRDRGFISEYDWQNVVIPKLAIINPEALLKADHHYIQVIPDEISGGPRAVQIRSGMWATTTFGYLMTVAQLGK